MKTLDEVIDAFECCDNGEYDSSCEDCPYNGLGACCLERKNDAFHYLKVLKDILDPLKVKKNSCEIICPQCNSMIAILLPESNEPLTWDELRQMKSKPVWVEYSDHTPNWEIVENIGAVRGSTGDFTGNFIETNNSVLHKDTQGKLWQAYRKERK